MTERLETIKQSLVEGIPYYGMQGEFSQADFQRLTTNAEYASLAVHEALYEGFYEQDPNVVIFGDPDSHEDDKYISFVDSRGEPIFGSWDPTNSSADIGVRGANPLFPGVANPTTIVHADTRATSDFIERGAPQVAIEAIDAVANLNRFVEDEIAKPFLEQVAYAAQIERDEYLANFFAAEHDRRQRILTRVIMYHLNVVPGMRPTGSDGAPLLIKEHNDRSSWTIDVKQTAPGLQYKKFDGWHDAPTDVAAFRGAADSYLPFEAPPALHRAVVREITYDHRLVQAGIARIAIPTFISPIGDNVRVVQPSSAETHPSFNG